MVIRGLGVRVEGFEFKGFAIWVLGFRIQVVL